VTPSRDVKHWASPKALWAISETLPFVWIQRRPLFALQRSTGTKTFASGRRIGGSVKGVEVVPPEIAPFRWTVLRTSVAAGLLVPNGAPNQSPVTASGADPFASGTNERPSRDVKHWASANEPSAETKAVPSGWISSRPFCALQRPMER